MNFIWICQSHGLCLLSISSPISYFPSLDKKKGKTSNNLDFIRLWLFYIRNYGMKKHKNAHHTEQVVHIKFYIHQECIIYPFLKCFKCFIFLCILMLEKILQNCIITSVLWNVIYQLYATTSRRLIFYPIVMGYSLLFQFHFDLNNIIFYCFDNLQMYT